MKNLIKIENLNLSIIQEKPLLEEFNLTLKENQRIGITGPSGCGKTTLLKSLVTGKPSKFSTFHKFYIEESLNGQQKIGYSPQSNGFMPWFTIQKSFKIFNCKNSLYLEIIEKFGLADCLKKYPIDLSGGEYQRAILAWNLILNPFLYLADEPLTEVDIQRKWRVLEYWSEYINMQQASLVLISHDIDTLLYLCDYILVLSGSPAKCKKVVKLNSPEYQHPRDIRSSILDVKREELIQEILLESYII